MRHDDLDSHRVWMMRIAGIDVRQRSRERLLSGNVVRHRRERWAKTGLARNSHWSAFRCRTDHNRPGAFRPHRLRYAADLKVPAEEHRVQHSIVDAAEGRRFTQSIKRAVATLKQAKRI